MPLYRAGLMSLITALGLSFLAGPGLTAPIVPAAETMRQRISRFNQSLKQQPALWRGEPVMIALFWAGPSMGPERSITYRAEPAENPNKAWVVITEEKLPDDSVAGSRVHFSFVLRQGHWELTEVQEAWRCRRGSRTSGYTPGLCP